MATQLKNIVRFTNVAVGATVALPHGLTISPPGGGDQGVVPDVLLPSRGGFTVTANATNVSVTNNTASIASVDVLAEHWHSMERAFGDVAVEELTPQPFVVNLDASGAAGIGSVIGFGRETLNADVENSLNPWYEVDAPGGEGGPVGIPVPRAGTLRNLFVRHNRVGNAGDIVYAVQVNGVDDPALSVTLAGNAVGQGSDLTGSIVVAQGDVITMTGTAGEGGGGLVAAVATMLFDD